jgi:hypothetical protein
MRRTIVGSTEEHYGRWMSAFREDDTGVQRSLDDLASGLASGTISRRRALKLTGAALLGSSGLLALFPGMAGAQGTVGETALNVMVVGRGGVQRRRTGYR